MALTYLPNYKQLIFGALLVLQIWASDSAGRTLSESSMLERERHEQWMKQFNRSYKNAAEKAERFNIFNNNVNIIHTHNAAPNRSSTLAINAFADLPNHEFLSTRTGLLRTGSRKIISSSSFMYADVDNVPATIDWRTLGAVTDVKDQGECGSCWAFSAVAAIEGINKISGRNLVSLSEQELVDCDSVSKGCSGGALDDAFEFIKTNNGLSTEADYPYEDVNGRCDSGRNTSGNIGKISGYEYVPANDESALMRAVARQPVSVEIDASGHEFKFYESGILMGKCGNVPRHAITIVGYGESEEGIQYWVAKNSWGADWGESGYIRMVRDSGTVGGICGIAMYAFYPTL